MGEKYQIIFETVPSKIMFSQDIFFKLFWIAHLWYTIVLVTLKTFFKKIYFKYRT